MSVKPVVLLAPDSSYGDSFEEELCRLGHEVYRTAGASEAVSLLSTVHPAWVVVLGEEVEYLEFHKQRVDDGSRTEFLLLTSPPLPAHIREGHHVISNRLGLKEQFRLLGRLVGGEITGDTTETRAVEDVDTAEVPVRESQSRLRKAWRGSLTDRDPARVLVELSVRRATGELTVVAPGRRTRVWFVDGKPCSAESTKPMVGLADILVGRGLLTVRQSERYDDVLCSANPGENLRTKGVLKTDEVSFVNRLYFSKVLRDLFSWDSGQFMFLPDSRNERCLGLPLALGPLLLEGIASGYTPQKLRELVGGADDVPRLRRERPSGMPVELGESVVGLMNRIDGEKDLRTLADAMGSGDLKLVQAMLYPLILFNMVEMADPERDDVRAELQEDAAVVEARNRIEEMYVKVMTQDYFSILGLSPDSSPNEARIAGGRLRREYAVSRFPTEVAATMRDKMRMIFATLKEAQDLLSHPELGEQYGKYYKRPLPPVEMKED